MSRFHLRPSKNKQQKSVASYDVTMGLYTIDLDIFCDEYN